MSAKQKLQTKQPAKTPKKLPTSLKKKMMKQAAKSAEAARDQLDQVILKLDHPAVKKVSEKFKANKAGDVIVTLTQRILEQAQAIRATLESDQVKAAARNPAKTLMKARKEIARQVKNKMKKSSAS